MKLLYVILLCLLGCGSAQEQQQQWFSSVQDALARLPQLSLLNQQLNVALQDVSLFKDLQDSAFSGTVFAPVNSGLKPLQDADLLAVLGDKQHVADLFSTTVVPGQLVTLDQLQHGMRLSTLNGHTVTISVRKTSTGTAYYANNAQIITANIPASNAVVHLVRPLVAAAEYQDLVDALMGFSSPSTTPTQLWGKPAQGASAQPALELGSTSTSSAGAVPPPAAAAGAGSQSGGSQADTLEVVAAEGSADGSPQPATSTGTGMAVQDMADDEDGAAVPYSYEQDFAHAELAAGSSGTAGSGTAAYALMSSTGQQDNTPAPADARNSTGVTAAGLSTAFALLHALVVLTFW